MNFAALAVLAFVSTITPGPNNLMLLASGMNHGVRRSIPHLLGVNLGFGFLLFLVAVGLGSVFERYRTVETILKMAGSAYLLYLAWRLFTSTPKIEITNGQVAPHSRPATPTPPLTFIEAAAFQWVNPKAWVMSTTAATTLLAPSLPVLAGALLLAVAYAAVGLPCIVVWVLSGAGASRWVNDAERLRWVNRILGVLLALTALVLARS